MTDYGLPPARGYLGDQAVDVAIARPAREGEPATLSATGLPAVCLGVDDVAELLESLVAGGRWLAWSGGLGQLRVPGWPALRMTLTSAAVLARAVRQVTRLWASAAGEVVDTCPRCGAAEARRIVQAPIHAVEHRCTAGCRVLVWSSFPPLAERVRVAAGVAGPPRLLSSRTPPAPPVRRRYR